MKAVIDHLRAAADQTKLITIAQLAAGWQTSESSIRRLMAAGAVQPVYVGRLLRFPRELLERGPSAVVGGKVVQVR